MKIIKKLLILFITALLSVAAMLLILGGGYGPKAHLPTAFIAHEGPFIFAHRGVLYPFPENSAGALQHAKSRGFPGVEIDVQLSQDQQFFLFHDKTGERLLNIPGPVTSKRLSELQQNFLQSKDPEIRERVLSLSDAIKDFGDDFVFYLDMKRYPGNADVVTRAGLINDFLVRHSAREKCIVSSADPIFIAYLEYQYPEIITCLEAVNPPSHHLFSWIPVRFQPDFIATFHYKIDESYVDWLKANDMLDRYIAYTIKSEDDLESVQQLGIEKFIADDHPFIQPLLNAE